jgi:branched-chain amino acid transport system permease protein
MQIIFNILYSGFIYLLIASSFIIIYYPTKFFHIAHAATLTFGAYLFYFFFRTLNLSILLALPVSILLSIIVVLLLESYIYNPLRKKNTSPLLLLIVSLGLYVVLQNCISIIWGDSTKNLRTGEIKVGNEFFGAYISNIQIITIAISSTLFILYLLFIKYHNIGKKIRAIAANEEYANIVGINSRKVILWSFGFGSGLASIAGILVASDTGLTPTMGFNLLLYGVVTMIIGGVGSTWGLICGAFLLASAQNLTALYIDSKWMDVITYIILILFLIWKPLGFSGMRLKKTEI